MDIADKLSSKEWVWGKNPKAKCSIEKRFDWGTVTLNFDIEGDRAVNLNVFTDALDTSKAEELKARLLLEPIRKWLIES